VNAKEGAVAVVGVVGVVESEAAPKTVNGGGSVVAGGVAVGVVADVDRVAMSLNHPTWRTTMCAR
jgi:hypothetical protein